MRSPQQLIVFASLVMMSFGASAAEPREVQVPLSAGVALEPSHRAHVISLADRSFHLDTGRVAWLVAEPARMRVLLPAEERALLASRAAADSAAPTAAAGVADRETLAFAPAAPPDATVYFPFDSASAYDLSPAKALVPRARQGFGVRLTGHADARGEDLYNLRLSERRASAVSQVFVGAGISPERVTAKGRGEAEPIGAPDDARNRRVEIRLVSGGEQ